MQQQDLMIASLVQLLETSLAAWDVDGDVRLTGSAIEVAAGGSTLKIDRAPSGMPFRWVIIVGERRRTAASVVGVIRIVREALTTGYETLRLRIAPLPPLTEASS